MSIFEKIVEGEGTPKMVVWSSTVGKEEKIGKRIKKRNLAPDLFIGCEGCISGYVFFFFFSF